MLHHPNAMSIGQVCRFRGRDTRKKGQWAAQCGSQP